MAILFGIQRFRMCLYGIRFKVITDHKPLVKLFSPGSTPPPRIERWVTRLMSYNYTVIYRPGSQNSADYLSRSNPLPQQVRRQVMAEDYINSVTHQALPKSLSLEEIAQHIAKDEELQHIKSCIQNGWKGTDCKSAFYSIRTAISVHQDVLLYNNRIIIPSSLRTLVISLAHEGHQGVVRTKQRLRAKVWWPGLNRDKKFL